MCAGTFERQLHAASRVEIQQFGQADLAIDQFASTFREIKIQAQQRVNRDRGAIHFDRLKAIIAFGAKIAAIDRQVGNLQLRCAGIGLQEETIGINTEGQCEASIEVDLSPPFQCQLAIIDVL